MVWSEGEEKRRKQKEKGREVLCGEKKKNVFPRFRLIEHQQNKMDGPLRQLAD